MLVKKHLYAKRACSIIQFDCRRQRASASAAGLAQAVQFFDKKPPLHHVSQDYSAWNSQKDLNSKTIPIFATLGRLSLSSSLKHLPLITPPPPQPVAPVGKGAMLGVYFFGGRALVQRNHTHVCWTRTCYRTIPLFKV